MDYAALAKQYGGSTAAPAVDYAALAKQFGGATANSVEDVLGKSTAKPERELGLIEQAASLPLTAATALTSGPATLVGMWGEALAGKEKGAAIRNALTFPTYTEAQQRQLQALSGAMEAAKLPPTLGGAGTPLNALVGPSTSQAANALGKAAQPVVQAVKQPLEARAARIQEANIAKSYENATKIDASQAAQRIGAALNPAESNPNLINTLKSVVGGTADIDKRLSEHNIEMITKRVREDLKAAPNEKLDAAVIERALDAESGPNNEVRKIPTLLPNDEVVSELQSLKQNPTSINKDSVTKVNALVDDVLSEINSGKSGASTVDDIRTLRRQANAVYRQRDVGLNPPDDIKLKEADARMAIAKAYEKMIDSNVDDPKLLKDIQKSRVRQAQIYDHERALDYGTNTVDPKVYAKMFNDRKGNMTGLGADIGSVAANYPNVVNTSAESLKIAPRITRGGIGATGGALVGGPVGMVIGGVGGYVAGAASAKRMMSPAYQAAHAIPKDYRPPVNNLRPASVNYGPNQIVPYDYAQQTFEAPNFVMSPNEYPPRATFVGPEDGAPQLGYGGTMETLTAEKARAAQMSRTLGQQAEQRQAAAEAAARQPTSGAVEMQINPLTGVPEISKGLKGATPETFQNFGTSLKSASEKVAAGQSFAMDATELSAWKRTTADLAEVMPGFKALDEKALAERMMDRKWVADALEKSRQKAAMFDDLAKRTADDISRRDAAAKREQLLDLADILEENLRGGRPVSKGGQGPKTRAHQRNMLSPEQEVQNRLIIEISGVGQRK